MYAFIEGTVCEKGNGLLVLEAGGVGYLLQCSMTTLSAVPAIGEKMKCHTYLSVREDAMDLYGFASKDEKKMFLSLTGISGVGAKMALSILGTMNLQDLSMAIMMEDTASLCRAPGVGKKIAQRIIMELKDKTAAATVTSGGTAPAAGGTSDPLGEALEAMIALGYTSQEAASALKNVKADTAEDMVRLALRAMAGT
ncbi:MAG: Holliday junction branch migration protein RuvA [Clostridia bacterium]|nr:Holliday junction branch migration protein RuvA [Clostridia bacterium]